MGDLNERTRTLDRRESSFSRGSNLLLGVFSKEVRAVSSELTPAALLPSKAANDHHGVLDATAKMRIESDSTARTKTPASAAPIGIMALA